MASISTCTVSKDINLTSAGSPAIWKGNLSADMLELKLVPDSASVLIDFGGWGNCWAIHFSPFLTQYDF